MPVDTRLTYEDYCLLPNDGKRYEIIEGELFVTPSPITAHQRIVTRLASYLLTYVEEHNLGAVFVAPFDVVFSRFDVVEPAEAIRDISGRKWITLEHRHDPDEDETDE